MLYRYKVTPMSPLITPLMSDTIFGHFCWAIRYEKDETFFSDFLNSYGQGKLAPVLFSSAFVSGRLPRPVLPPLRNEQIIQFIEEHFLDDSAHSVKNLTDKQKIFLGMGKIRGWSRIDQLSIEQWKDLKDDYSELRLLEIFYQKHKDEGDRADSEPYEIEIFASNTINRISGTVKSESGGLFQREKTWFHKDIELDLYVEINAEEMVPVVRDFLTDYLPQTGFGADKTIGMGKVAIIPDENFDPDQLKVSGNNAQLALSLTSFTGMENYKVYYILKTKFGKLGGDFAFSNPKGGNPRPFKKPVLMYEPGAVFLCDEGLNCKALLENIHSDDRIRHCGVPVTLPFRLSEDISHENTAARVL